MYLLNTETEQLEIHYGNDIPAYAILSHTWLEGEEITFKDITDLETSCSDIGKYLADRIPRKKGSFKIERACEQARTDGYKFVWIDTFCIDKSSSAELSEAINSMYHWYANSGVCYAYLEDVVDLEKDMTSSRWFTRGWTLQELVAPKIVVFFGRQWNCLGDKTSLSHSIAEITGISELTLLDPEQIGRNSIARRMSWASKRQTKRTEDMAYSLLGIFGVNMALIYGEGDNAFIRLQEEIMRKSDDQSLFAWELGENSNGTSGLLAQAPRQFVQTGSVVPTPSMEDTPPYSMSNKGLHIHLSLLPVKFTTRPGEISILAAEYSNEPLCVGLLQCQRENNFSTYLGVLLKRTNVANAFVRARGPQIDLIDISGKYQTTAIKKEVYIRNEQSITDFQGIIVSVRCTSLPSRGYELLEAIECPLEGSGQSHKISSRFTWDALSKTMRVSPSSGKYVPTYVACLFYRETTDHGFAVAFSWLPRDGKWTIFALDYEGPGQTCKEWVKSIDRVGGTRGQPPFWLNGTVSKVVVYEGQGKIGTEVSNLELTIKLSHEEIHNQRITVLTLTARDIPDIVVKNSSLISKIWKGFPGS